MKRIFKAVSFIYLYISHFSKRHSYFIVSGFIAGFFISLFALKFLPSVAQILLPYEKKIGLIGDYDENTLPYSLKKLISLGLTEVDRDGSPLPSLSSSWVSTDSGKKYIFHLKDNILWHDGKEFQAQDITYNIKGTFITALDKKTLLIELQDPFSPLPSVLSRPVLRNNLIGLGVYKVTNLKFKGEYISALTLSPLKEGLPILNYKFYSTLDEAILAFKLGEINVLEGLPTKEPFAAWKNIIINEITLTDKFLAVFFNLQDDIMREKDVRQGLSFAIPDFKDNQRVFTPVSPSSWAYYNKVRIYKYDPENAQKILEDSLLSTSSAELKLSTYAFYLPFAQKIADSWNSIGIKTKVKVERSIPDDYQALLIAQEIPLDPDQYQYWHSSEKISNVSHYNSLKIDKLLEDGRKTHDKEQRKKIYADFQRYLVDDAPAAFLFFPKVYTIERK